MKASQPSTHRWLLAVSVAILVAATVLQIGRGGHVMLPLVEVDLPSSCTFKRLFSIGCPGCGLTRCFISAAHGEWTRAWTFNPLGIVLFGLVAVQIPYRLWQLWRLRRGLSELRLNHFSTWALVVLALGLVVQWVVRVWYLGVQL